MRRAVFLTVILASAILAFVQAGPVPKNQEDAPAKLNEVDKFQKKLEEIWKNVRNTMDKNYNELLEDPSVSASFLNTFNELIDEVNKANSGIIEHARDQVDNLPKPNGKAENNANIWQDFVSDSWNAFQERMWDQYEKCMENPKVQEIVREIENAMRTTKDILEEVVEDTRARIDAERSENADQFVNNSKVNKIIEKFNKALDKTKQSLNNIISSIRKKPVTDSRSYNLEETQEPQVAGFKEKVQEAWSDLKNNLKEKARAIWNNPKVKEVVEKGEQAAEQAKKAVRDAIENVRNEIDRIVKEAERLKENADTTSWKEKAEEAWNDFKKKVQEKSEEVKNNPKVKEIIEATDKAIEDAKGDVKKIAEAVRKAIESISKEAERLKENADPTTWKKKVEEAWNDFKKKIQEKSEEVKNNPKVKEIIEATDKAIEDAKGDVKKIAEAVRKAIESISKEAEKLKENVDTLSWKEKVEEAWNDFKKKIQEKSEEVKNNPKVKEIIEATDKAIEDAKGDVKKIAEAVRKAIESISNKTEVLEEPPHKSSVKENIERAWNDFKRIITDKVDEILRDPKTKDILDKSEKVINDVQENVKGIIESIRKAADDSSKDTDENSAKSAAATYVRNVKEAWDSFKRKIATTYKNVWEKERVKIAVSDSEHLLLRIPDSAQDVVDSIRRELEKNNAERL